jgi:acetoin utilization deacetylase AcuC-like enzyme
VAVSQGERLPTVWDDRYHCPEASPILATRKHKVVVDRATAAGLLDIRHDSDYDEERAWAEIARIHAPEYVNALRTGEPRTLAESQGFTWGPRFAAAVPRVWSGARAAARIALTEGLAFHPVSGGHHAERDHGAGFCTVNGVAGIGSLLLAEGLVQRVAVIDLDTHQGNGTWALAGYDPRFGFFDVARASWVVPECETDRALFRLVQTAEQYFGVLDTLPRFVERFRPELLFYLAGMDCHEADDMGGVPGMNWARLAERDSFVFKTARSLGIPLLFSLAGGYQADGTTVDLHLNTIRAALDREPLPVVPPERPDRTYKCVLRDRDEVPIRTLEWTGVPPETLLVTLPLEGGAVVAAPTDAQPGPNQAAFRRMLYRPRILVTYYNTE